MIANGARLLLAAFFLVLGSIWTAQPLTAQDTGTLVFAANSYTSSTKLSKKIQKQLEHAGLRWGMVNDMLVVSMLNERYVKAELEHLTRFGEVTSIQLKPGKYSITCVGYEFASTSSDPEKALDKSAFINQDVATFSVAAGKTTRLEIVPVFEAESQWRLLTKFTFYLPTLKLGLLEDGDTKLDGLVINHRDAKSIAWPNYHGPLKF